MQGKYCLSKAKPLQPTDQEKNEVKGAERVDASVGCLNPWHLVSSPVCFTGYVANCSDN